MIAIDGKTVRGAKDKEGKAPHLVAALAHGIGAVLGQVAVEEKSNEIPAVRELLKAFTDLAGAVLTSTRYADVGITHLMRTRSLCRCRRPVPYWSWRLAGRRAA